MGAGNSHNVKVHAYVNELRKNNPSIIYDHNNKFISKKRMKRMAYKSIYNSFNKVEPVNISKAERHFRNISKNKICQNTNN